MPGFGFALLMIARALIASVVLPFALYCQNSSPGGKTSDDASGDDEHGHPSKRIFWIIPNFRTSPTLEEYKPISPGEKFKIAAQDSFDPGTIALAAAFAGEGQLSNGTRSFGQGVQGYARYFGAAYGDFLIGNYMTEGIYPTILHQDPRYFRRERGSGWSRLP